MGPTAGLRYRELGTPFSRQRAQQEVDRQVPMAHPGSGVGIASFSPQLGVLPAAMAACPFAAIWFPADGWISCRCAAAAGCAVGATFVADLLALPPPGLGVEGASCLWISASN